MKDARSNTGELLLLTGREGDTFAIPREIAEQYRLTPPRVPTDDASEEVTGYILPEAQTPGEFADWRRIEYVDEAHDLERFWSTGPLNTTQGEWRPLSPDDVRRSPDAH